MTVWPRLEIGNSSVTPWSTPRTIAWKVVISGLCRYGQHETGKVPGR